MTENEVLSILVNNGFVLDKKISIDYGVQLVFRNGAKVSVYHTGNVNLQGKHVDTVNELLGRRTPQRAPAVIVRDTRNNYFIAVRENTKVSSRSVRIDFACIVTITQSTSDTDCYR